MIEAQGNVKLNPATPGEIFALLADPDRVVELLPRMRDMDMLHFDEAQRYARLATFMDIGGPVGTVRCEGDLRWEEPQRIVFLVDDPVQVEMHWHLQQASEPAATNVHARLGLDLRESIGPVAGIVPDSIVENIVADELRRALEAVVARHRATTNQQRQAAD